MATRAWRPFAPFILALPILAQACSFQPANQTATDATATPPMVNNALRDSANPPTVQANPSLVSTWTPQPPGPAIQRSTEASMVTPTATATLEPRCDQPGRMVRGRFPSALSPPDFGYRVYLPPCYGEDGRAYPVLYMLPGNIHDDSIWDQLGLDEAAEQAINEGGLPPLLIVMPEGGQIAQTTSGGPYSYEGLIINELIPYIEVNYCAWTEAAGRAIGGLSRGGYWALEIAFRQPGAFASVGGHAAALVDTYAGPNLDPKYTALSSNLTDLRIYLDAGQNDWYLTQLQILHDNLLTAGKAHTWVIQEGGHDNAYWSTHVIDYLRWYTEPWSLSRSDYPSCTSSHE